MHSPLQMMHDARQLMHGARQITHEVQRPETIAKLSYICGLENVHYVLSMSHFKRFFKNVF